MHEDKGRVVGSRAPKLPFSIARRCDSTKVEEKIAQPNSIEANSALNTDHAISARPEGLCSNRFGNRARRSTRKGTFRVLRRADKVAATAIPKTIASAP